MSKKGERANVEYPVICAFSLKGLTASSPSPVREVVHCGGVLETLATATEQEFLQIGLSLRDYYERAVKISEVSSSVAGLMAGAEVADAIERMNTLMERVARYLKQSESRTKLITGKLMRILDVSDNIHAALEEYSRITRPLHALGISTKIQSAMVRKSGHGFQSLGEEVKTLSKSITRKTDEIHNGAQSLTGIILNSLSNLQSLEERQRGKAAAILESTAAGICSLTEKYGIAAGATHDISACSVKISQSIKNVVTSLQFHDITRQQFERSRTAFDDMAGSVAREFKGNKALSPSGETGQLRFLREVIDFCACQAVPLQHARNEFVSAVSDVIENLGIVAAQVRDMLEKTLRISGSDRSSASSFLSEIEGILSSVKAMIVTLSESALLTRELSGVVTRVVNAIGEISEFISGMEDVGDDLTLIALNAEVNADHMGEEGRSLCVIAEAIQRISREAQVHTASISEMLKSISSSAEELSKEIGAGGLEYEAEVEAIAEDIEALVNSLHAVNGETADALYYIDEAGWALSGDIEKTIEKISVHTFVDNAVGEVLSGLEEIASSARMALPDAAFREDVSCMLRDHGYHMQGGNGTGRAVHAGEKAILNGHEEFGYNVDFF